MKKTLLLGIAALLSTASAYAVTDGQTYAPSTNQGSTITCKNLWIFDRNHAGDAYVNSEICDPEGGTGAGKNFRTSTLYNGVVYVCGTPSGLGKLVKFDAETGKVLGSLALTVDGKQLEGTLCANQILVDSYGHLIVIGATFAQTEVDETHPLAKIKVYSLDPETGALTVLTELEREHNARIDYYDCIGDVTGEKADGLMMAAAASDEGWVYRWKLAKGTKEWKGNFEGAVAFKIKDFYLNAPEKGAITAWGIAPVVKIVRGEGESEFAGDLFYVDGFTAAPILYDSFGGVTDSFENAVALTPEAGANGVAEFTIKGRNFLIFANHQHTGSNGGNEIAFCELGENMAFEGMNRIWLIPADGMNKGLVSDGGARYHGIFTQKITDNNGKEGAYLLTAKDYAGLGVYLVAEEGFSAGVEGVEVEGAQLTVADGVITVSETADVEVYNVAGQKVVDAKAVTTVAAPTVKGAYVVKATVNGKTIVKKVVL